jgi:hypothetical protein
MQVYTAKRGNEALYDMLDVDAFTRRKGFPWITWLPLPLFQQAALASATPAEKVEHVLPEVLYYK